MEGQNKKGQSQKSQPEALKSKLSFRQRSKRNDTLILATSFNVPKELGKVGVENGYEFCASKKF